MTEEMCMDCINVGEPCECFRCARRAAAPEEMRVDRMRRDGFGVKAVFFLTATHSDRRGADEPLSDEDIKCLDLRY